MKFQSLEPIMWSAWKTLIDMLIQDEIVQVIEFRRFYAQTLPSKITTTLASNDKRELLINIDGWSGKEDVPISRIKEDLVSSLFTIYQIFFKAKNRVWAQLPWTTEGIDAVISWEEIKTKE